VLSGSSIDPLDHSEKKKIGRNCNGVAHDLACLARQSGINNVWLKPVPDGIRKLCNHDSVTATLRGD
jgi:hypothetical protein